MQRMILRMRTMIFWHKEGQAKDMKTLFIAVLLISWTALSLSLLVSAVQGIMNEHKREKRDKEYHKKRMNEI